MRLQLCNVHTVEHTGPLCITVQRGRIGAVGQAGPAPALRFADALAFPGLINSHDHLDFNLFPPLGNRLYDNYVQWGRDIHQNNPSAIRAVQQIPEALRARWGVYKNLCCGITTVVNHGKKLQLPNRLPIAVFQRCHHIHSVAFEDNWKRKLQRRFRWGKPFVVHTGEGTDELSHKEIDVLLKANRFGHPLVAVHGVAMTAAQARGFAALVWCPASNQFLLGQTAAVDKLAAHTPILFGTDSTLTAPWDIWQHLRLARQSALLPDAALLDALTVNAAKVWGLKDTGRLAPGQVANMVVARAKGLTGMDAFFSVTPGDILLVLHRGRISLFDESLLGQLQRHGFQTDGYERLQVGQSAKYVSGNVGQLTAQIRHYYPAVQFFQDTFHAQWAK
jgi:cytosine/adenosine deaminase-related metal-dependent hydrolase